MSQLSLQTRLVNLGCFENVMWGVGILWVFVACSSGVFELLRKKDGCSHQDEGVGYGRFGFLSV